jgi:hypothetical protein
MTNSLPNAEMQLKTFRTHSENVHCIKQTFPLWVPILWQSPILGSKDMKLNLKQFLYLEASQSRTRKSFAIWHDLYLYYKTIHFPLGMAFAATHHFWYVVFSFSFQNMLYFLCNFFFHPHLFIRTFTHFCSANIHWYLLCTRPTHSFWVRVHSPERHLPS